MTPEQERGILEKLDELVVESRLTRAAVQRGNTVVADHEERISALEDRAHRSNGSSAPPGAE